MKRNFKYILASICMLGAVVSCKDDQEIIPEWESAVHGLGGFADGSAQNFLFGDPNVDLDLNLRWISIDDRAEVTKIQLFVLFNESFTDPDGNPSTAKHGGDEGKLLATFEGSNVPEDNEDVAFTVTQADIYALYQDNTYDYDKDELTAETEVYSNPDKPDRTPSNPFVKGDAFQIRWEFTTADGRLFNKWGVSVCTEFPGANCTINWGVICVSDLAGTYDVSTSWTEYYGSTGGGTYVEDITATAVSGKYLIEDLSGGMEPEFWGNPLVDCTIVDECSTIKLDQASFSYLYGYSVLSGSTVNQGTGVITIKWQNVYGENGINVYTPQ